MSRTIIVATWDEQSKAYQALAEIENSSLLKVNQAGVFHRDMNGRVTIRDGESNTAGVATFGGGLLGSLIGILGGPLGVLLGFSTGALFGSLADLADTSDDSTVLAAISSGLRPGKTALIADLDENDPNVIDALASSSGANLTRYSYDDVLAEVQSAEAAAHAAAKEADKVIREQKRAEKKVEREQKWEETKAKFKSFFERL